MVVFTSKTQMIKVILPMLLNKTLFYFRCTSFVRLMLYNAKITF